MRQQDFETKDNFQVRLQAIQEIERQQVLEMKSLETKTINNQLNRICFILLIPLIYFMIAGIVWSYRNPTANSMTWFSQINHVLCWDKLPEFQIIDSENVK
jgi:hypothetical protein